jgi:hypothetical protein
VVYAAAATGSPAAVFCWEDTVCWGEDLVVTCAAAAAAAAAARKAAIVCCWAGVAVVDHGESSGPAAAAV